MSSYSFLTPSRFLSGNFTISTLPSASSNSQMYAWVTDLHDNQPDLVISDGTYWKPVRPLATRAISNGNLDMTFTPLVNSPTQIEQGTFTAIRTTTLSNTNAYPGAKFRIKREASGLLARLIVNAVGSNTIASLSASSWADFEYVATTGWMQTASGGLL